MNTSSLEPNHTTCIAGGDIPPIKLHLYMEYCIIHQFSLCLNFPVSMARIFLFLAHHLLILIQFKTGAGSISGPYKFATKRPAAILIAAAVLIAPAILIAPTVVPAGREENTK
jgi:hypothetical protein